LHALNPCCNIFLNAWSSERRNFSFKAGKMEG
jgi:hypothetical protein